MALQSLPTNLRGAVLLMLAIAGFSLVAACIKLLGDGIPVMQIVLVRQAVIALILVPALRTHGLGLFRTERLALHSVRVVGAFFAMVMGFAAVVHLPLADATTIGFAKSFFLTIFAVLILREAVGVYRWTAVIVGFVGVLIVLQPGGVGLSIWSLAALASAALVGLVMVIVKRLTQHDSNQNVMAWQAYGVGALVLPFGLAYWVWPSPSQWLLLGAMGTLSYVAQRFNIEAYRVGEASLLASLDYVRLLYAVAIGYLLFADLPSAQTWAGSAVIISAALI
ncbi:MAG: DMT family transporter, partial [Pseudomonadota bacterium]